MDTKCRLGLLHFLYLRLRLLDFLYLRLRLLDFLYLRLRLLDFLYLQLRLLDFLYIQLRLLDFLYLQLRLLIFHFWLLINKWRGNPITKNYPFKKQLLVIYLLEYGVIEINLKKNVLNWKKTCAIMTRVIKNFKNYDSWPDSTIDSDSTKKGSDFTTLTPQPCSNVYMHFWPKWVWNIFQVIISLLMHLCVLWKNHSHISSSYNSIIILPYRYLHNNLPIIHSPTFLGHPVYFKISTHANKPRTLKCKHVSISIHEFDW